MGEQRAPVQEQRVTRRQSAQTPLHAPGSRLDFALFYSEHLGMLTRFVMRLGASPYEAAEAAHAAFVEAFPKWSQITTPRAWLRTVAARAYLRQTQLRDRPTDTIPDQPGGECPLAAMVLKDEEQHVCAALSALPPRQRQVMAWHLDGFSHSEISDELGITVEAVRQNYARARVSLKRALGLTAGDQL
ncbi:sigma-70 family RNA polymerase sigma factor [Streptomyces malaysiensis subsp. malaysiensis]|uniref:RNA polymerase sigma factor n=1 Tax=Streptomyces malaysiensis TaxID=92644 RepID=UPI000BFC5A7D|nr:sigma-70 family RNA polymerase sigma factor [Streptomyces malaysiensis]ATL81734.1 RNA polymerase ECF sigma factor [Streptomyces malaysiensis]QDL73849.1 sigma-70 family RNA polymerase sigma factor [Streptomyces malaysiensis]